MPGPPQIHRPSQADFQVLLTAGEAYPALERAFLSAKREIWASFRIFDLCTKLHSPEAQAIGNTWFDLIIHTLKRGVAINMVISDFDPVAWGEGHRKTWRSVRMFIAAAELAGPQAKLTITPAMHPARSGLLPQSIFWPAIMAKLVSRARWLNDQDAPRRVTALREMPGVASKLVATARQKFRARLLSFPWLVPATHHQKLAVFDRETLYIGGLDLNNRRYDTPDHNRPGDETWHDVQLLMRGPVVAEAQKHLESFLDVTAGKIAPPPLTHLIRTMSRPRRLQAPFIGPDPVVHEIASAHQTLGRQAKQLIYVENQYFRDRKMARFLAGVGKSRPDLSMILILPAAPDDVAFEGSGRLDARFGEYLQARSLRILRKGFGYRLFVGGAAQARRARAKTSHDRDRLNGAPIIYLHAKVSIFDEASAIVSSANLNGRSLRWDTEAGVMLDQKDQVRALRHKLMAHWLPDDAGSEFYNVKTAARAWHGLAATNAQLAPEKRRGFILPYDLRAAEEFGQPVPIISEDLV